ncbi:hypothetical protein CSUI_011277, partial [Cystoisospora suis]
MISTPNPTIATAAATTTTTTHPLPSSYASSRSVPSQSLFYPSWAAAVPPYPSEDREASSSSSASNCSSHRTDTQQSVCSTCFARTATGCSCHTSSYSGTTEGESGVCTSSSSSSDGGGGAVSRSSGKTTTSSSSAAFSFDQPDDFSTAFPLPPSPCFGKREDFPVPTSHTNATSTTSNEESSSLEESHHFSPVHQVVNSPSPLSAVPPICVHTQSPTASSPGGHLHYLPIHTTLAQHSQRQGDSSSSFSLSEESEGRSRDEKGTGILRRRDNDATERQREEMKNKTEDQYASRRSTSPIVQKSQGGGSSSSSCRSKSSRPLFLLGGSPLQKQRQKALEELSEEFQRRYSLHGKQLKGKEEEDHQYVSPSNQKKRLSVYFKETSSPSSSAVASSCETDTKTEAGEKKDEEEEEEKKNKKLNDDTKKEDDERSKSSSSLSSPFQVRHFIIKRPRQDRKERDDGPLQNRQEENPLTSLSSFSSSEKDGGCKNTRGEKEMSSTEHQPSPQEAKDGQTRPSPHHIEGEASEKKKKNEAVDKTRDENEEDQNPRASPTSFYNTAGPSSFFQRASSVSPSRSRSPERSSSSSLLRAATISTTERTYYSPTRNFSYSDQKNTGNEGRRQEMNEKTSLGYSSYTRPCIPSSSTSRSPYTTSSFQPYFSSVPSPTYYTYPSSTTCPTAHAPTLHHPLSSSSLPSSHSLRPSLYHPSSSSSSPRPSTSFVDRQLEDENEIDAPKVICTITRDANGVPIDLVKEEDGTLTQTTRVIYPLTHLSKSCVVGDATFTYTGQGRRLEDQDGKEKMMNNSFLTSQSIQGGGGVVEGQKDSSLLYFSPSARTSTLRGQSYDESCYLSPSMLMRQKEERHSSYTLSDQKFACFPSSVSYVPASSSFSYNEETKSYSNAIGWSASNPLSLQPLHSSSSFSSLHRSPPSEGDLHRRTIQTTSPHRQEMSSSSSSSSLSCWPPPLTQCVQKSEKGEEQLQREEEEDYKRYEREHGWKSVVEDADFYAGLNAFQRRRRGSSPSPAREGGGQIPRQLHRTVVFYGAGRGREEHRNHPYHLKERGKEERDSSTGGVFSVLQSFRQKVQHFWNHRPGAVAPSPSSSHPQRGEERGRERGMSEGRSEGLRYDRKQVNIARPPQDDDGDRHCESFWPNWYHVLPPPNAVTFKR